MDISVAPAQSLCDLSTTAVELPSEEIHAILIKGDLKHEMPATKSSTALVSVVYELVRQGSKKVAFKLILPVGDGFLSRLSLTRIVWPPKRITDRRVRCSQGASLRSEHVINRHEKLLGIPGISCGRACSE